MVNPESSNQQQQHDGGGGDDNHDHPQQRVSSALDSTRTSHNSSPTAIPIATPLTESSIVSSLRNQKDRSAIKRDLATAEAMITVLLSGSFFFILGAIILMVYRAIQISHNHLHECDFSITIFGILVGTGLNLMIVCFFFPTIWYRSRCLDMIRLNMEASSSERSRHDDHDVSSSMLAPMVGSMLIFLSWGAIIFAVGIADASGPESEASAIWWCLIGLALLTFVKFVDQLFSCAKISYRDHPNYQNGSIEERDQLVIGEIAAITFEKGNIYWGYVFTIAGALTKFTSDDCEGVHWAIFLMVVGGILISYGIYQILWYSWCSYREIIKNLYITCARCHKCERRSTCRWGPFMTRTATTMTRTAVYDYRSSIHSETWETKMRCLRCHRVKSTSAPNRAALEAATAAAARPPTREPPTERTRLLVATVMEDSEGIPIATAEIVKPNEAADSAEPTESTETAETAETTESIAARAAREGYIQIV